MSKKDILPKLPNRLQTMGLTATLSPFVAFNSSSRVQMLASHVSQMIQPEQSDIPRTMTGFEIQLADNTFNIKMPTNGIIISIHRKYYSDASTAHVMRNPLRTIIYQCQETGIYDYIDIYEYHSKHKTFGCKFILNPIVDRLKPGMGIAKDTILAHSPSVKEGGIYSSSIEVNVAYMSMPGTIEDGFVVSESFCKRASPLEIGTSVVEWGKKAFPLNIYGDENNYKPFPDIGDKIRDDGLVFALREYDTQFDAVEMSNKALMEVDMIHDIRIYGNPGAEVFDIIVDSGIGESRNKPLTPKGMEFQPMKYINQTSNYYTSIKNTYDQLVKGNPRGIVISPSLQALVTYALSDKPNNNFSNSGTNGIIRRTYKNNALDEYRVVVRYEKRKNFNMGSKITDFSGGKGVVCHILPDEYLPIDSAGNRADIVSFAKAAVSRLNPGQFYEHYINAASRDMSKWVRLNHSILPHDQIWNKIMSYYEVTSPEQYKVISQMYTTASDQIEHIKDIIDKGIYLVISPDSDHLNPLIFHQIEKIISPTYGPVSYIDAKGKRVTTKDKVFIGVKSMIVLEKTEQRPMAVSSACLQHHGLISGNNREIRNAHPSKQQSTRILGETENRLFAATMGGDTLAEMLDMANNPESHREVVRSILEHEKPFLIPKAVDRNKIPLGGSRVLSFFNHVLFCTGCKIIDE